MLALWLPERLWIRPRLFWFWRETLMCSMLRAREKSTNCPSPVRILWKRASSTEAKKPSAPHMSPMTEPMRVGFPSGSPVWSFRPDMATAQMS